MEGLGDIYSGAGIYGISPRKRGGLVDWLMKVLFRLEWCDLAFQDVDGVMDILQVCE